jgi:hypothetical protein
LISISTQKLCTTSFKDEQDFDVSYSLHPTWRVRLRPGRYVATFFVDEPTRRGDTQETGLVGLLASTSRPERVLPTPACR